MGTTDTDCQGDPADVHADAGDIAYILEAVRHAFPVAGLSQADIVSAYAGFRPLIADDAPTGYKVSREHQILNTAPGFFTIAGGKLTTWRSMAEEMVDELARCLGREHGLPVPPGRRRQTTGRTLPGSDIDDWHACLADVVVDLGDQLGPETVAHLVSTYGTRFPEVLACAKGDECLVQPLLPDLAYLKAEVVYAIWHEMAVCLEDVLARRTHLLDRDQGLGVAAEVAALMGAELGWSEQEQTRQVENYRQVVAQTRRWRN